MAKRLEKQAQKVFENTKVVKDFDVIDIPFNKKNKVLLVKVVA